MRNSPTGPKVEFRMFKKRENDGSPAMSDQHSIYSEENKYRRRKRKERKTVAKAEVISKALDSKKGELTIEDLKPAHPEKSFQSPKRKNVNSRRSNDPQSGVNNKIGRKSKLSKADFKTPSSKAISLIDPKDKSPGTKQFTASEVEKRTREGLKSSNLAKSGTKKDRKNKLNSVTDVPIEGFSKTFINYSKTSKPKFIENNDKPQDGTDSYRKHRRITKGRREKATAISDTFSSRAKQHTKLGGTIKKKNKIAFEDDCFEKASKAKTIKKQTNSKMTPKTPMNVDSKIRSFNSSQAKVKANIRARSSVPNVSDMTRMHFGQNSLNVSEMSEEKSIVYENSLTKIKEIFANFKKNNELIFNKSTPKATSMMLNFEPDLPKVKEDEIEEEVEHRSLSEQTISHSTILG